MNLLDNNHLRLMENSINASATRQDTIASNIANVDTPGYKAKKTVFQHQLDSADARLQARQTDERHIPFSGTGGSDEPQIVERQNTTYNHNGNSVDIDKEMSDLAENQIYYNALIERLNGRFSSIRTALGTGGGR
ncbi:flagellar basal body rod protein FlgB [Alkalicoccus chagannorensis]|uniref:flagellar basal body rod protein FlgB n=1 Tax=Alkalicoccus chagannorensis TaxID=427072 RepID=UPI0003F633C6|nr:flagellar basal body rod protein FlgB [Alkalicoccus chagannorensis]